MSDFELLDDFPEALSSFSLSKDSSTFLAFGDFFNSFSTAESLS
jgi:hypothetical protein